MFSFCEIVPQLRESEMEKDKAILMQQVNELQEQVVKLNSANESMHHVSTGWYKNWPFRTEWLSIFAL